MTIENIVRALCRMGPETSPTAGLSQCDAANIDSSRLELAPAGSSRRREHRPPRDHALALVDYLASPTFDRQVYFSSEQMRDAHIEVCHHLGWWPRPWAPVARQYRLLANSDRRTYADFAIDGRVCRKRVYHLPGRPQGCGYDPS